jgi:protoheme IX farnesyltransferase
MNTLAVETKPVDVRQLARDLIAVCKPGIIVLLLISTGCPMIVAAGGRFPYEVFFQTLLGGALLSASASCLNCLWDRDIDRIMERTKQRPIAAGRLSASQAVVWAIFLGGLGLWVLWNFTNPVAALVGLSGHLFYFLIYTVWLKRTTPQNIVIGGAAGAVPPIVGWAAVTGELALTPFLMFLIIFLWTPPHFWALALNRNEDYRRAGIPMLPVVAGARATHLQMLLYAFLLVPASAWLVESSSELGLISWVGLTALSLIFFMKVLRLSLSEKVSEALKVKRAWDVFGFSLVYLALFFLITVIDASVG